MRNNINLWRNIIAGFFACCTCFQVQAQHFCAKSHQQNLPRKAAASVSHNNLMNRYDLTYYKFDINLERTSTFISGNVLMQAKSKVAALDTFAFELHSSLQIDSIILNNSRATNINRTAGEVTVVMPNSIPAGNTFSAQIYYKGTPPSSGAAAIGNGMTNDVSPSWGNRVTWSLSEPFAAYEWFPSKQILTDKIDSVDVWVTTNISNKVGSNGVLQQVTPMPNNQHRYEWKSRYPIAYYLISVAVSDYVEYNISANPAGATQPVLIQNYIYSNPQTLVQFQDDIDDTAPMLELFSLRFGLYPFHQEKYGHSMVPISGGMEHQTMTSQGFFDFTLTAHELGHQWFGDNVTCGSWRDIWLNEGFASYSEYIALDSLRPTQAASWLNGKHNSVKSQPGGSIIVPAADSANVFRIFDSRLTYNKGAAVVHMLRNEINNDSLFFATLQNYQQQFKDSTAVTSDLLAVVNQSTGANFQDFFQQWIFGEGFPIFQLSWNQVGNQLILQSTQTTTTTVTPLFKTSFDVLVQTTAGDTIIRFFQDQNLQLFNAQISGNVTGLILDPENWLLNDNNGIVFDGTLTNLKENVAQQQVNIYPNPASGYVTVSGFENTPMFIEIMDVTGKVVKTVQTITQTHSINVSDLAAGRYVLRVMTEKQVVHKPLIINR